METVPALPKNQGAEPSGLATDIDQQSYQRLSQTSDERMRFGRWWTF